MTSIVLIVMALLAIIVIVKTAVVVPQQNAYVIEFLGKYNRTLHAGFHLLLPFAERIAGKHDLPYDFPWRQVSHQPHCARVAETTVQRAAHLARNT